MLSALEGSARSRRTTRTRDALLYWDGANRPELIAAARMTQSAGSRASAWCWQGQNTILKLRCHTGSIRQDDTWIREVWRTRSPTGNEALEKPMRPSSEPTNKWKTIDEHLEEIGFKRIKSDPSVYISKRGIDSVLTL